MFLEDLLMVYNSCHIFFADFIEAVFGDSCAVGWHV